MNATAAPYVSPEHVAELAGVSKATILHWARNGEMPAPARLGRAKRVLRWPATTIDAWLAQQAQPDDHPEPREPEHV